jgi:hypothetical protein
MKKLHALYLRSLHLAAHFDFFEKFAELLATAGDAVKAAIAPLMPDFAAGLANEEAVMGWVRRSTLTKHIIDASRQLDRVLVGINAAVQTGLHSSLAAVADAAGRVRIMLQNYGNMSRQSYDTKAGNVRALFDGFAGPYATDAATLGLTAWIQELRAKFDRFEELLRLRADEWGKRPRYTARAVQRNLDAIYHRMVYLINAGAAMGASPDFAAFIDYLNPEIDRLNAAFHRSRKPPQPAQQL